MLGLGAAKRACWLVGLIAFTYPSTGAITFLNFTYNGLSDAILAAVGTIMYERYGFPQIACGLSYLGIAFGSIFALVFGATLLNPLVALVRPFYYRRRFQTPSVTGKGAEGEVESGIRDPEGKEEYEKGQKNAVADELVVLAMTSPLLILGVLGFGWALASPVHWMVPLAMLFVYGVGRTNARLCFQVIFMEAVPGYSGSGLGTGGVASVVGTGILALGTWPLFNSIGYGWGCTIIALMDLVLPIVSIGLLLAHKLLPGRFSLVIDLDSQVKRSFRRGDGSLCRPGV